MKEKQIYAPSKTIVAQIVALQDMSMADLYQLWEKHFGAEALTKNRPTIIKRLAFKIQQSAFENDKPDIAKQQAKKVEALIAHCENKKAADQPIIPGAVLSRFYQGKLYEVTVHKNNQYEFEGRIYSSLSPIATEITGTKWSGPRFFGIQKVNKKTKNGAT